MFKRTKVSTAAVLALGGAAMFAAVPVQAQEGQRIEITGSSIKRIDADDVGINRSTVWARHVGLPLPNVGHQSPLTMKSRTSR